MKSVCVCILVSRLMTDKRFAAAPTVKQRGGHSRKACDSTRRRWERIGGYEKRRK